MADFRPFNALRFDLDVAGDASDLVAPPYDVVTTAEAAALYANSPFNIARVDYGPELPGDDDRENRYTRARAQLDDWRRDGVLKLDAQARLFAYDQEFEIEGKRLRRRAVFGRLRVEDWDSGIVLPHEHTRARDKQDRLDLLRATRVNTSPIMALYATQAALRLSDDLLESPVMEATLAGDRHTLSPLKPEAASAFSAALANEKLWIADGHHRYETALNYRNEVRSQASTWTGEEPENFVMAALIDATDPGLVVLPIHRLLKLRAKDKLVAKLSDLFDVERVGGLTQALHGLEAAVETGVFATYGLEPDAYHLVRVKDQSRVAEAMPAEYPAVWRSLDVALLHYVLLPQLGFEHTPDNLAFDEEAEEAVAQVKVGGWDLAILMNPTRVQQIIDVAGGGERMPQKSTFFYPKLGTGLVHYAFDPA